MLVFLQNIKTYFCSCLDYCNCSRKHQIIRYEKNEMRKVQAINEFNMNGVTYMKILMDVQYLIIEKAITQKKNAEARG